MKKNNMKLEYRMEMIFPEYNFYQNAIMHMMT